jgi:hypothetical protein
VISIHHHPSITHPACPTLRTREFDIRDAGSLPEC